MALSWASGCRWGRQVRVLYPTCMPRTCFRGSSRQGKQPPCPVACARSCFSGDRLAAPLPGLSPLAPTLAGCWA